MSYPSKSGSLVNYRRCSRARCSALRQIYLNKGVTGMNTHQSLSIILTSLHSLVAIFLNIRIVHCLKVLIPSVSTTIPQNIVYKYPTIEGLAHYLSRVVTHQGQSDEKEHCRSIDAMIAQYSVGLVVLMTGSTGHLGCHLLTYLTKNSAVHRIYALNRSRTPPVEERHRERFRAAGLSLDVLKSSKVVFVEGDLSTKNFGLSEELYSEVCTPLPYLYVLSFIPRFNNR